MILPSLPLSSRRSRVAPPFKPQSEVNAHFIGEAFERRPWAIKREDRPAAFAGRSFGRFNGIGYRSAYTGEYPIPPRHAPSPRTHATQPTILRNPLGKIERRSDESNVRHYS